MPDSDLDEFTEAVTNCEHLQNLKYRPTMPYAFTEQGVAMLAAVLNSQKAIDVNIQIMRAFIQCETLIKKAMPLVKFKDMEFYNTNIPLIEQFSRLVHSNKYRSMPMLQKLEKR